MTTQWIPTTKQDFDGLYAYTLKHHGLTHDRVNGYLDRLDISIEQQPNCKYIVTTNLDDELAMESARYGGWEPYTEMCYGFKNGVLHYLHWDFEVEIPCCDLKSQKESVVHLELPSELVEYDFEAEALAALFDIYGMDDPRFEPNLDKALAAF